MPELRSSIIGVHTARSIWGRQPTGCFLSVPPRGGPFIHPFRYNRPPGRIVTKISVMFLAPIFRTRKCVALPGGPARHQIHGRCGPTLTSQGAGGSAPEWSFALLPPPSVGNDARASWGPNFLGGGGLPKLRSAPFPIGVGFSCHFEFSVVRKWVRWGWKSWPLQPQSLDSFR